LRKPSSEETDETKDETELSDLETNFSLGNKYYYEEHNYEKAIEKYEQALDEEDDELTRVKITYMMAESHVKIGKFREAKELFKTLALDYKQHYLNDSARKRLEHLADYLVDEE
jgi:tetratricopeptide (TPR) repeat protein